MRLAVQGHGPTVIKLAGLAGGTGLYREEMTAAAAAGFRVAALDTSGDRFDDPAPSRLSWDGLAAEVLDGLERLGTERAVLWGSSFGCLVALAVAARRPERVAGLLLCFPPEPGWRPPALLRVERRLAGSRHPERATAVAFRCGFILLCAWELASPSLCARLPGLVRASVEACTPSRTIAQKVALLWHDHPGLPSKPVPARIVGGAWDLVASAAGARRLASTLPGSRLRLLGATGHAGAYARPRAYRRVCLEELRGLHGGGLTA